MLDPWISVFIFSPLVVLYWRGTWQLLDLFLLPEEPCLSALTSFVFGTGVIVILGVAQEPFTHSVSSRKIGRLPFFISSRLYTLLFCFAGVNHWRGVWQMLDCHAGINWLSATLAIPAGVGILVPLRTLRTVIAPPFTVVVDHEHDYFRMQTMFRTKANAVNCAYISDVIFSVFVVGSAVVFVWWGVWTLFDLLVYPESVLWSGVTCCFLGYFIALLCFSLQPVAAKISRNLTKWTRILFEDLFTFLAIMGAITVWRGLWFLLNIYFIPDDGCLSNSLTHAIGIIALITLHSSNSVPVRGVTFDAEHADGSGCFFQVEYLTKIKKMLKSRRSYTKAAIHEKEPEKLIHTRNTSVNTNSHEKLKAEAELILQKLNSKDDIEALNCLWIKRDSSLVADPLPHLGMDRETVV